MTRDWEDAYRAGTLPWDTGEVEPLLEALVTDGVVAPGRALEVGCGTGTNAVWLASKGFDVVAIDVAPSAIARASEHPRRRKRAPRFLVHDLLGDEPDPLGAPFDFVFDRGVFHTFDDPDDRSAFVRRVASLLGPSGVWYSLIGSTEGPPRSHGPPRRSAAEVVQAIEPHLEIALLFSEDWAHHDAAVWACLSRSRAAHTTR